MATLKVIVSQSPEVARGTAAMVPELVGDTMPLACCCGRNVAAIVRAIELQPPQRQGRLVIGRAPIMGGALVAAGEDAAGATGGHGAGRSWR